MNTRFRFERLVLDRLRWQATLHCLQCGQPVTAVRGEHAAVLRIGGEVVGIACRTCLTPESRAQLESLRGEVQR